MDYKNLLIFYNKFYKQFNLIFSMNCFNKYYTFDKLISERLALIDTSVFVGPFGKDKKIDPKICKKSLDFFMDKAWKNPGKILITSEIIEEYLNGNNENIRSRHILIRTLKDKNAEVELTPHEHYDYQEYFKRYRCFSPSLKLSAVDFDIALKSLVISKRSEPLFVLTNDKSLASFIVNTAKLEKLTRDDLYCLVRWAPDTFGDPFK